MANLTADTMKKFKPLSLGPLEPRLTMKIIEIERQFTASQKKASAQAWWWALVHSWWPS